MSSIAFSFTPSEVITAGTTLELRANRAVSPKSAMTAVRLLRAGTQIPTTVTVQGMVVQVSTDKLSPAAYQVVVTNLLDTNNQLISEPIVVPVVVGAMRGVIPKDLRVQHVVHLAVGDTTSTRIKPGMQAPAGTRYLEIAKAINVRTGMPVELAFDDQGKPVDGSGLLDEVEKRRFAKYGRIHEALWDLLQKSQDGDVVNVIVWPKIGRDHTDYEKPNDRVITEPLPQEIEFLGRLKGRRSKLVELLKQLNATIRDESANGPTVSATLTAGNVKKLALTDSDGVGLVSLADERTIPDLKDSIAVSRTDFAQSLGYTGAGVRIAVYEDGPSDTTNLVFAGRYTNTPPASDHARLTSAIIKNVEPSKPHGHAPNCDLYSANSGDPSNYAFRWALDSPNNCTVVNQSFHRSTEETTFALSADDLYKDWFALHYPYPTIVQAAGDGDSSKYVTHKGYNTISVGSHDDSVAAMASDSVFRNPHGDRELPELCANGTGVTALGLTMSGTSFAAPAVAGITALVQEVNPILKSWPEACRAILLASAGRNVVGSTWWDDVLASKDSSDGSGAVDAQAAVKIAQNLKARNAPPSVRGWHMGTFTDTDFGTDKLATFRYNVTTPALPGLVIKIALAWDSVASDISSSVLMHDFDLVVRNSNGESHGSASLDNSYEIVEFLANPPGSTYEIVISRWKGTGNVWYGIAWTTFQGGKSLPFEPALTIQQ